MTYIEMMVTTTAIASVGNLLLQSAWFIWSHKINERKHFTDKENHGKNK